MRQSWAIRLNIANAALLGPLRQRLGFQVCEQRDALWLRFTLAEDELDAPIRAVHGRMFRVLADLQLVPIGRLLPQGRLPAGPWTPLAQWLNAELPAAAFAGQVGERVNLKLVPGGSPAEANALLTTAELWHDYATRAPLVRLSRWTFAMSDDAQVLVRGTPLPPLRGARFVQREGVAIPAGWTWFPPVDAEVVRTMLAIDPGDLALFRTDGTWQHVAAEHFVQATHAAVRLSMTGAHDE